MAATKKEQANTTRQHDGLKWLLITALVVAGVLANIYYGDVAWALRAAAGIVVAAMVLGLALWTAQGQRALGFMKVSRTELRKVAWPTRQETIQMTIVVVIMVIVTAIILWGLDSFFFWLVSWLTGQRG